MNEIGHRLMCAFPFMEVSFSYLFVASLLLFVLRSVDIALYTLILYDFNC